MKKLAIIGLIVLLPLFGCSNSKQEQAGAATANSQGQTLKDGTYFGTYETLDAHGWQPFLQFTVQGGKITSATFDYINGSGELKTNDQGYKDRMEPVSGTYPAEYSKELQNRFLKKQSAPVDTVTGATSSSGNFNNLAQPLLEKAKKGDTSNLILPMNETYTAEDQPDEHGGWIGHIEVTFKDGKISNVSYDEVKKEDGKITARKSEDKDYAERFSAKSGITQDKVYQQLAAQLQEKQDVSQIDAVSGATGSSDRFIALAKKVMEQRQSVSPQTIQSKI